MKRIRSLTTIALTLVLILSFLPGINAQAIVKSTVIDGVTYTMNDRDKFTATLSENVTPQKKIHVLSKITLNGKVYDVSDFFFLQHQYEDDLKQMNYKDSWYKIKSGSWQAVLQKITFDSGIEDILIDCVNYPNLEEVSFDAKGSNPTLYNCPKLKYVKIGKNVRHMFLLQRCPNAKIIVDSANPRYKASGKDLYSKDGKTLYMVSSTKSTYRVRKGVTKLAGATFTKNDYIKSIILPDTVKKAEMQAFSQMKNLSYIRLSCSMKETPYNAFVNSKKLKTITYPANIKKINGNFGGKNLCGFKKIYINTKNLKASNMKGIPGNCSIYVKNKSVKNRVRKNGFRGKIIIRK